MTALDNLDRLFIACAFIFQIVLVNFFALRRWRYPRSFLFGLFVYGLSIPAAMASVLLLLGGKPWLWAAGFVYLLWGIFGYSVEYVKKIQWRNPVRWPIYIPYVVLFLTTAVLYWWPLAWYGSSLWNGYAMLFLVSSLLNAFPRSDPGTPDEGLDG